MNSILIALLKGLLPEILSILQVFIKNPASLATEQAILTEIYNTIGLLLGKVPTAS